MATDRLRVVIQRLHRAGLPLDEAALTDGQLLERYVSGREEAAFAALVRRHGPMVWGVCRRALRSPQDAEDAFQATFLVLVRRAASVVPREMVANWLYGVAHKTALKARAMTARRGAREKQVTAMPEPALEQQELCDRLQPLLDQELSHLPDKYRVIIALCDLEGKTRKEAARQLSLPEGTVASRHATARAMLARRLARHGLPVSGAALAAVLAQNEASAGVPIAVTLATIKAASRFAAGSAAGGVLSVKAVVLAEGTLKAMLLSKLKVATAVLVAVAVLGATAAALPRQVSTGKPADRPLTEKIEAAEQPVTEKKDAAEQLVTEKKKADWPQWRGPNRDGIVHGVTAPAKWPRALAEEWKVPVGDGVASPVVAGGSIYVFTRQKNDELVRCLDLQSGTEIWHSEPYSAPYKVGPGEGNADDRPRSTPAVADGRVFTLGMTGILSCFDAARGTLLWRKETKCAYYGGSSPMVLDGMCIAQVGDAGKEGGLTAFDVKTGDVKWCFSEGISGTSGSPILVDLAGERHLVTYSNWNACGVSPATGKKLWGVGPGGAGMPCTTGLQYRDLIILADNMDSPRALRLEKGDKGLVAKQVWKAKDHLKLYYSSPVVAGDRVFGMSTHNGGCFFCLDARTGNTLWESEGRQGGYASFVSLGSAVLLLKDRGQLLVVKPSGAAFETIAEYRVSDTGTMAHPVFLGDRILIRDTTTLRSLRIEPDDRQR
jgi:RNA polymerase sigma factor (sigma-70 family)